MLGFLPRWEGEDRKEEAVDNYYRASDLLELVLTSSSSHNNLPNILGLD